MDCKVGEQFQSLCVVPLKCYCCDGYAPLRFVVDGLVHTLSWNRQGGKDGLRCIHEVLEPLKIEQLLEVGVGKERVDFFLSFAGSCYFLKVGFLSGREYIVSILEL